MERGPSILESVEELKARSGSARILVTGAAGFIGSHLVYSLLGEGYHVAAVLRSSTDTFRLRSLIHRIEIIDADLRDIVAVNNSIKNFRPDVIFHLAAQYTVEHELTDIDSIFLNNVLSTINLLQSAVEVGTSLFVNTSSCFVYGQGERPWREHDKARPWNLYALTKLQAEETCSFYSQRYCIPVVTLRIFPPYGPGDHDRRLIPSAIKCFLEGNTFSMTGGEQRWDFVYIDDIVRALLHALNTPRALCEHMIVNIGTGKAVPIREIVMRIKELTHTSSEPIFGAVDYRENELFFMAADIEKASKQLNWVPEVDILKEGLTLTVEWYEKEREDSQ